MEKLFLTLVLFWFSVCSLQKITLFGDKIGYRKEVCHFYSQLCEFGRRLEGGSGGIGNTLYLLRVDYGWFCRCTAGKNPSFEGWKTRLRHSLRKKGLTAPYS